MALIICPECKKEVSDQAEVCIHCGYPLKKKEDTFIKKYSLILKDAGENVDFVIGLVQECAGVTGPEAKDLCGLAPKLIRNDLSEAKALEYKRKIEEFGATVEIEAYDVSNMMSCPACGSKISRDAFECPNCGHSIKERPSSINFMTIFACVCLAILIMSIF